MPYIEEEDLLDLHNQIEKEKKNAIKIMEQVRSRSSELARVRSVKNVFASLFTVTLIALIAVTAYFVVNPEAGSKKMSKMISEYEAIVQDLNEGKATLQNKLDSLLVALENKDIEIAKLKGENPPVRTRKVNNPKHNKWGDYASSRPDANVKDSNTYGNNNRGNVPSLKGRTTYAVQIGTFERFKVSMVSENFLNFREYRNRYFSKYAIGDFETIQEARDFRQQLIKLGFKDCFVVSIKNGRRLRIEDPT